MEELLKAMDRLNEAEEKYNLAKSEKEEAYSRFQVLLNRARGSTVKKYLIEHLKNKGEENEPR